MGNDIAAFGSFNEMTGVDYCSALFFANLDLIAVRRGQLAETAWAQTGRFELFWAKLNGSCLTSKPKYSKHESYPNRVSPTSFRPCLARARCLQARVVLGPCRVARAWAGLPGLGPSAHLYLGMHLAVVVTGIA